MASFSVSTSCFSRAILGLEALADAFGRPQKLARVGEQRCVGRRISGRCALEEQLARADSV